MESLVQMENGDKEILAWKVENALRANCIQLREGWYEVKVFRLHKKDLETPGVEHLKEEACDSDSSL
jgi:hypothetical protein